MSAVAIAEEDARDGHPQRPLRLVDRIREDPAATVVPVAALLIVVQLALRGWAGAGGYFLLDDLVFVYNAQTQPFDANYLFTEYAGHLMPGAFALVSMLTALTPLSWPAVVGINLVLQLAIDVAMLRLLVLLFGRRPAVLLPLTVFLATSITLPAFLWWAAALNQLPMQLAVLLAMAAHVRYLRTGRATEALRCVLAIVGGLLFSEKTILVIPLLVAVTLGWFTEGGLADRVRTTLRLHRTAWLPYIALALTYTIYYVTQVASPIRGGITPGDAMDLIVPAVFRSVLPGLLGGPWVWEDFPPALAITAPPVVLQWVSALVVALVVLVSVVRHRGAARAWLLFAAYLLGTCLLIGVSRAQVFGPFALSREYRYFTDVALVAALCLALAFLPVRDGPVVLRERRHPTVVAAVQRVRQTRWAQQAPVRAGLGAAVVLALVAGSVVSTMAYARRWDDNPTRPFIENARADIAARPGTVLIDGQVPDPVMWRLLGPYTMASRVLSAVPGALFLEDGQAAGALSMLDETGKVRPAWVPPTSQSVPGPTPNCGWLVADRPVPVPLAVAVGEWRWVVRVTWLSAADNYGSITAGDHRVPVLLPAGLHETYLQVSGDMEAVTVELADPTRPVCINSIEVGNAQLVPPALR